MRRGHPLSATGSLGGRIHTEENLGNIFMSSADPFESSHTKKCLARGTKRICVKPSHTKKCLAMRTTRICVKPSHTKKCLAMRTK